MNMDDFIEIQGHRIPPGEHYEANVNIARLHTWTDIDIPVFVYRSQKPGPVLLLTACVHGDELNGVEILRRMIRQGMLHPDRGSVVAIPIMNVFGFLYRSRELPDGKDLNRRFPGTETGSLASRMAHFLSDEILPQIDYGIDFHTGSSGKSNYPQIRCDFEDDETLELARDFGAPFVVNARLRESSLRKQARDEDKSFLTFEGGEALRFDRRSIEEGVRGTCRVMNSLDMIQTLPQEQEDEPIIIENTTWVRAHYSGLFQKRIGNGDQVSKNQTLGIITDPFGKVVYDVAANQDGYVIGLNHAPTINKGDALVHLGTT